MLFGVGISCRISFCIVSYLFVSCSRSITSVVEERAHFSAFIFFAIMWFLLRGVSSSSGCLRYVDHMFSLYFDYL